MSADRESSSPEALTRTFAHPRWLVERWVHEYGFSAAYQICKQNQSIPTTAIRLRTPLAEEHLTQEGITLSPGALLTTARRVHAGDITKTKAFRTGEIAIQDEASQLIASLVGHGARILDCCAAPGGKTLAIADHNPESEITAVELHPHRARLLHSRLHQIFSDSSSRIEIVTADVQHIPATLPFDRVLADVPCSGTGTIGRNPEIKWRLTTEDLVLLPQRQSAILRSALAQVAPGGRLIYSTCSLEKEENENVIEEVLSKNSSFRVIDCRSELLRLTTAGELIWPDPDSLTRGPYLRTIPGMHPCDGFFAAVLERTTE
jgi:16S rRNA (cytosine967-C5)-methyltransferase